MIANVCAPVARPVSESGDEQGEGVAPSSAQVVESTLPVVVHAIVALVSLVDDGGALVRVSVGAPGADGDEGAPGALGCWPAASTVNR